MPRREYFAVSSIDIPRSRKIALLPSRRREGPCREGTTAAQGGQDEVIAFLGEGPCREGTTAAQGGQDEVIAFLGEDYKNGDYD